MNANDTLTRRAFLTSGLAAGALTLAAAFVGTPSAAQAAAVDPADPTAKSLDYTTNSPKSDQKCAGCALYQGKAGDPEGPCLLFQGKSVSPGGWCKGWAKKP
jgi:hypothetical protein